MTARAPEEFDTERLNREGYRLTVLDAKRDRYSRNVERGLCARAASHGPAEPGHSMCIGCLVDQRHDQNARNAQRAPRKRVLFCKICERAGHNARSCTRPKPQDFDPRRVAGQRQSAYRNSLGARGLCINGSKHEKPEPGFRQCAACRARGKATS